MNARSISSGALLLLFGSLPASAGAAALVGRIKAAESTSQSAAK